LIQPKATPHDIHKACILARARTSMLESMRHLWNNPSEPLLVGYHTKVLCAKIDKAKIDFKNGISTRLTVTIPFRHGKSDISSRYGPADLLGWDPDLEIMLASYASDLSEDFSRDIKAIMDSDAYRELYPEFPGWDPLTNAASKRRVFNRRGKIQALGMRGGATGKGAHVLVLDDTFKNREEAESPTLRKSRWDSFRDDFFSRLAPVHIIIVVQTRWHVGDTIGMIEAAGTIGDEAYVEDFPKFEKVHFRARGEENIENTGSEFLFPARFNDEWYKAQFGVRSDYAAASLLQGEPYLRGGNMLKLDNVNWLNPGQSFPTFDEDPHWIRHWDIAHSKKEVATDDPDYTAGGRVAVIERPEGNILLVDDLHAFREEATGRNAKIIEIATRDKNIPQSVEANGAQKSAYTTLRDILKGKAVVTPFYPVGDKVTRAGYIEPIFEAGNVYIRCNPVTKVLAETHLGSFPMVGVHDDIVDVVSDGYQEALRRNTMTSGLSATNNMDEAFVQ